MAVKIKTNDPVFTNMARRVSCFVRVPTWDAVDDFDVTQMTSMLAIQACMYGQLSL